MNLIPYESELMEYHNRCLNINELQAERNQELVDQPEGILDSFPRPYIIGKVVDELVTIETEEFEEVKMTATELRTTWTWSYPMGKDNNAIPTKRKVNHN